MPPPDGSIAQTEQWYVAAGSDVTAAVVEGSRQNEFDVLQQLLLLTAGMVFGLIPAAVSYSMRHRRKVAT
jgi:hypothetical protein